MHKRWAQDTCLKKKGKTREQQLWQWKGNKKWQSVSILLHIHCGRWLVKVFATTLRGHHPPSKGGRGYISNTPIFALSLISWQCSGSIHRRKKMAVLMQAAIPFKLSWACFIICIFSPYLQQSQRSHDCLPLLLHHRWGFLVLAGPCGSWMLLIRNVKLLSWWRYGVLGHRAVLHVTREVAVTIYGHWSQPRGEVEGQWCSGGDVGDTGVWHHRSIAVCVTAAPSFSFEVQCQSPPAPWFFDLSLDLRGEEVSYPSKSSNRRHKNSFNCLPLHYKSSK